MRCLIAISLLALSLSAATVTDAALGSSLAGATVSVTRFGGSMASATFTPSGLGAIATLPGSFTLTVGAGDTSVVTWTLTNTDTSLIFLNNITGVTIDLTLSGSALFDSGTTPSTPASGPGLAGVVYSAGVTIGSATEFLSWADPDNTGDMFRALTIAFSGPFVAGGVSSWTDDTDVIGVPEPSAWTSGLLILMGLAFQRLGRPRQGAVQTSRH